MSTGQPVKRDERTVAVENAACKWGFYSVYLGILLDGFYRHKVRHEDIGDLFVVLGVGVAVTTVYLIRHKATTPPLAWWKFAVVYAVVFVVVAFLSSLF
jgi:hypothetical protein